MQKYNGQLINQFSSSINGNAAAGALVTVRVKSSGAIASLYASDDVGGATLPNPLTTDSRGYFGFYAADGVYTIDYSVTGTPQTVIQLQDVADLQDQFNDALANAGYIPVGTFAAGCTVSQSNGVVSDGSSYWRWDGALPKTVTAGSAPTPTGVGGWFVVSDQALRGDLADSASAVLIAGVEAADVADGVVKTDDISFAADPLVSGSFSGIYGEQTYAGNIGAGSFLLGMYRGSSKNRITGSAAQLRGIIGGYDNEIVSTTTADGLACGIVWSMHSKISNFADHCGIGFGSYHEIENGSYSGILSGTTNKILGTYNVNGNDNSVIPGGARNTINGANSTVSGADNNTKGNGLSVSGILNSVGQTTASDYVFVTGQSNTVNRSYSFTHGLSNTSSRDYTFNVGRSNTNNADYTSSRGRGAIVGIAFSDTFSFDTGSNSGCNQRDKYPLQITTSNATATNMISVIQGSVGDVMPDTTACAARATVIATDGTDTAVFDLKACLRRNGGTTAIYNLSTKIGNTAGAATWAAVFGGQNDRRIVVTGEAAKTIKWTADVELVTTKL